MNHNDYNSSASRFSFRGLSAALLSGLSVLTLSATAFAVIPPGAPAAPNTPATTAAFPKRITASGPNFGAWDNAFLYPQANRAGFYATTEVVGSNAVSLGALLEYDQAGNSQRQISAVQYGTLLSPTSDAGRFFAYQHLGTANDVTFGVYNNTAPYAAVYQHKLTIDPKKSTVSGGWMQGRTVVTQDLNNTIEVMVFDADGSLRWARRLTSSAFGVPGGNPLVSQSASAQALADGSLLVQVTKSGFNMQTFEIEFDNTLVKLSSEGGVDWAKKPIGLAQISGIALAFGNSLYLSSMDPMSLVEGTPVQTVTKLTLNGTSVWSKSISGALLSIVGELPGEKMLLSGFSPSGESGLGASVLAVMNSQGGIDAQTRFAFSAENLTLPAIEGNRIWLATVSGPASEGVISTPSAVHLGLTDATLGQIQWKKYKNNANFAMISPHPLNDELSASFFIEPDHALEAVTLKDDFSVNATCALFTAATLTATNPNLTVEAVQVTLSDVVVTSASFAPTIQPGNLTFESLTVTETSLCNGGGGGTPVTIAGQPQSLSIAPGNSASFTIALNNPSSTPVTIAWRFNGATIPGATGLTYTIPAVQSGHVGIYSAVITAGASTLTSTGALLAIASNDRIVGSATEVGSDIHHPNGNIFDQYLLTGASATVKADPGQVTRISYIDLNDDIVQVEFSGAGTLTLTLSNPTGPAQAVNYNQPTVSYMKGHATITFTGTDASSNLSFFSVGKINAVNQTLFKDGVAYDGVADIALLTIASGNNTFGGLRAGNGGFFASSGETGLIARGVNFTGPVILHDINGRDNASPRLITGNVSSGEIRIAGGDLQQLNGRTIEYGTATSVRMAAGSTSHGTALPARQNLGSLERNGENVTGGVVINP
ncbi:MAG TPA: hypothetical protein PLN52_16570 [Opitutaceae bacterium]|nr:hypothetical protein [Opitutaceae bacterium]